MKKSIPEDSFFKQEKELQTHTEKFCKDVDVLFEQKEKEVMQAQ